MHTNSWPMLHGRYRGIFLIEDFIVRWVSEERATGKTPEFRSWAWKTSYVMGMLTADSIKEFVTSGRMKVSHGDFKVIYKELGGDTPTGTVSGSIIFST